MRSDRDARLVFAVFADDVDEVRHALLLAESIRTFAGGMRDAPVWIHTPAGPAALPADLASRAAALHARIRPVGTPEDSPGYPYARKVFAAAAAETEAAAATGAERLVWMDPDTVLLREPVEFLLPDGVSLGYRPVMHRRIGSPCDEPPDGYWARIYALLHVPESAVFPVVAPADEAKLRAYFNAGLLAVRPARGILASWARAFSLLHRDEAIAAMCRRDRERALFLHQAALAGAILAHLPRTEMLELPPSYNVPLFFKQMHGGLHEFDSIEGVVTLRYDEYFQNPAPDWSRRLRGPADLIAWLEDRLGTARGNPTPHGG